jgi:hypothetical protein
MPKFPIISIESHRNTTIYPFATTMSSSLFPTMEMLYNYIILGC